MTSQTRISPDPRLPSSNNGILRPIALVILGIFLVWIILTRSLAASLAENTPATALALQPQEPRALLRIAKTKLTELLKLSSHEQPSANQKVYPSTDGITNLARLAEKVFAPANTDPANTPEGPSLEASDERKDTPTDTSALHNDIRMLAEQAIAVDPWNADALVILGRLAEHDGDIQRTADLMRAAARLSIRESYAVYWLLLMAQRNNDAAAVLRYSDTLLRTRGGSLPLVVPLLAQAVEKDQTAADVTTLLATDPPWRTSFLATLPSAMTDARTPLHLFQKLAGTAHPPTHFEISRYITFLIGKGFYELAYYTWLQFQPPEQLARITALHNPGFDAPPSGFPFDWTLSEGSGVTLEIRPLPGESERKALFVEFTQGRADFRGVSQTTLLGPGTYELKGSLKGTVVGARGLVWRTICTDGATLGQSALLRGDFPQWRSFSFAFTVPETGCRAQQVRLELDARSASERLVTGSMWFDDLELRRSQP